jgi:hypothetical protein
MNVRCEASNAGSDIRCKVCGHGFLLHWASESPEHPQSVEDESILRAEVHRELRRQHTRSTDHPGAHPHGCFHVQLAEPEPEPSLPEMLAEAPVWATV